MGQVPCLALECSDEYAMSRARRCSCLMEEPKGL